MKIGASTTIRCTSARYSLQHGVNSLSLVNGEGTQLVVLTPSLLIERRRRKIPMKRTTLMIDGLITLNSESQYPRRRK